MNLLDYLKKEPKARERKNKNRAIGNVILEKYHTGQYSKEVMADIVGEVLTLDRQWRKILEENPDLRGADYDEKTILEQKKMLELGYEPGFSNHPGFNL
jgi:hypothetical protein